MNWRRGFAFALLHLSLAVPLIVWQDAHQWKLERRAGNTAVVRQVAFQKGVVGWEPKTICYFTTPPEQIVRYVNLPASIVAGWHYPPHSPVTVAAACEAVFGPLSGGSIAATAIGFTALIFLQWLLVGALPIIRPKRRWLEPAVLISVCGILSTFLLLVLARDNDLVTIPLLFAIVTWFVWAGVAVVKLLKSGWKAARRHLRGI